MSDKKTNPAKVIIKNVKLCYVHLLEPYKGENDKAKYSVVVLVPKSSTDTVAAIKAAIKAAYEDGQANKWAGKGPQPKDCHIPLRDGDKERADDEAFKGCYFLNCSCNTRPGVIDVTGRDLTEPGLEDEVYSGMMAHVSITMFAYSSNGSKGISSGLNNVCKVGDGTRLGGRNSAAADFADCLVKEGEAGGTGDDGFFN